MKSVIMQPDIIPESWLLESIEKKEKQTNKERLFHRKDSVKASGTASGKQLYFSFMQFLSKVL